MNRSPLFRPVMILALLCAAGLAAAPCALAGQPATKPAAQPASVGGNSQPLPDGVGLDKIPAHAIEVSGATKDAKVGQTVTIHGRIPLAKDAFNASQGTFTIIDDAAAAGCCPKDGSLMETCTTASKMTIKLVGKNDQPLGGSVEGKGGLRPGAEVFVVGKVAAVNADGHAEISATTIHVPASSLPIGFFASEQPGDSKDVADAKKQGLKKGDQVVLRGVIGGSRSPFVAGRAMFTLMGKGLKPCNANPADNCKYPWDYCCETKADIAAHSATIRVADDKGNPLKTDIKGRQDIAELTEVIVVGTVAMADKNALVVDATSMHRVK